ncbi:MAG: TetR/AcrR family transcriptional regulator [Vicinamibacterales bacterium]
MAARRQQILDAVIDLFSRRGFNGTTTREIAKAAGVAEALIFRHFARKEDLYAAILQQGAHRGDTRQWLPDLRSLAERGDDHGLLTTLFRQLIAQHDHAHDFLRLMLYSALEEHALTQMFYQEQIEPLQQFLLAYITKRQRDGVFRACDAPGAVRAILALPSHHVLVTRLLRSSAWPVDDQAAVATFADFVLGGLLTRRQRRARPRDRHRKGKR